MSTQYKMTLNKKYILNTLNKTIVNTIVKVSGIISYDEAMRSGYDVRILGINEKVVGTVDLVNNNYLENLEYYKCSIIDKVTGLVDATKIIIVWSDIIDSSKTNLLEEKYTYDAGITVGNTGDVVYPIDTILSDVSTYAYNKYMATITFTPVAGDDNVVVDVLTARLAECNNVLRSLQGLSVLTSTLDKLNGTDFNLKLTDIDSAIATINEKLTTIAAGLQ